ncbi:U8 snoRNA-decapping enzyme-like [Myxocyprinus asiaticus]|uniref:U8 snoRNA-decapping enzyme-like n=1 Tax=Myxocyprinus asiaticus TaxID=70543 RepID=UPI002221CCF5|nr:U8 snoRNA-decapping enzyme-like [Myxocyprinus asiaticus]
MSEIGDHADSDVDFQQDNTKPHNDRITSLWLRKQRVRVLDCPACGPDLSPIENVLRTMKCKIRLVNPSKETLEVGLSRELDEEVGMAVPVGMDNHISSCLSTSCPRLITHFYIKKMTESELRDLERAAVATATDHGLEVLSMVRVPLFFLRNGGGLPYFLSHLFISNSRAQQLSALQHCGLLSQGELEKAVRQAEQMRCTHSADPH